jgi:hypothetical protein
MFSVPEPLFYSRIMNVFARPQYAVSPDNTRFLVLMAPGDGSTAITVVTNWPSIRKAAANEP